MKRALITGGAGFIAHHLIGQILKNTDWEIITLDRLDYSGNLNRLHDLMLQFDPEVRKRVSIVHHDLKAELNPLVRNEIGKLVLNVFVPVKELAPANVAHKSAYALFTN